MRRIAIVVEGQTEEAFVSRVLQPYLGWDTTSIQPIVVHTQHAASGRAHRGGGRWKHYDRILRNLLAERHWTLITTLIDYYGYPTDAPRCDCGGGPQHPPRGCVRSRAAAMAAALPRDRRFLPFLALHEFETLVVAAAGSVDQVLANVGLANACKRMLAEYSGDAELVDDGPTTAPSKRLIAADSTYMKTRDGVAILEQVGLDTALSHCPGFAEWVRRLRVA